MKKEYVKPQNRVVVLKYRLMDQISQGPGTDDPAAKANFDNNSDDIDSDDIWED